MRCQTQCDMLQQHPKHPWKNFDSKKKKLDQPPKISNLLKIEIVQHPKSIPERCVAQTFPPWVWVPVWAPWAWEPAPDAGGTGAS